MSSGLRWGRITSLGVLVLAALLTLFILACGEDDGDTPGPGQTTGATASPGATTTPTSRASTPVQPRLRVSIPPPGEQQTMPHPQSQISARVIPFYDHLIGRDIRTNEEQTQLATEWDVAPNGRDWTFELRDDVPFYKDGEATDMIFSAKDVVLTWDLLNGEEGNVKTARSLSPGEWFSRLGTGIDNWETPDDHTIILRSPKIFLDGAFFMSDEWATGIVSKDHWDAVGGEDGYLADPIGNGPWTYEDHAVNEFFLHKAVDGHYRISPEFEELEIRFIQEAATRLAALLNKEVDIIPLLRANRQQVLQEGFEIAKSTLPGPHSSFQIMYYRPEAYCPDGQPLPGAGAPCGPSKAYDPSDPTRQAKVRLALNYAINRNELNDVFFFGEAFPAVAYFPPWREDWRDEWAPIPGPDGKTGREGGWPYPYDVEGAKELLTEAGFPNGFDLTLSCYRIHPTIPEWPDICEKAVQYFAAINVRTNLEFFNAFAEFRAIARARERSRWIRSATESLDPICSAVAFGHVWELGIGYQEYEPVSEFWQKCNEVTDLEERRQLASDLGTQWLEEAWTIPLYWVFGEAAINPSVVEEYSVNMLHMGPVRYHEYTKAVMQ